MSAARPPSVTQRDFSPLPLRRGNGVPALVTMSDYKRHCALPFGGLDYMKRRRRATPRFMDYLEQQREERERFERLLAEAKGVSASTCEASGRHGQASTPSAREAGVGAGGRLRPLPQSRRDRPSRPVTLTAAAAATAVGVAPSLAGAPRKLLDGGLTPADMDRDRAVLQRKIKAYMRSAAMEFQSADLRGARDLSATDFAAMVRERLQDATLPAETTDAWFRAIDANDDGKLTFDEWFRFCAFDVENDLGSGIQIIFADYDTDADGRLSRAEFTRAVDNMGFGKVAYTAFVLFDRDLSGYVDYHELVASVRAEHRRHPSLVELSRALSRGDALRGAAAESAHGKALTGAQNATRLEGTTATARAVKAELEAMLRADTARVIDLFKDFDDDQSGLITLKEFGRGLRELGYTGGDESVREIFDEIDSGANYRISFTELDDWLNDGIEEGEA